MSFLKAEWRKLAIANYQIEPAILNKYLPYKTELELWNNTCYISLVGFMFLNTQILGIKIPFHINFAEANLRFYVKYKDGNEWKRGVVFIKEIVPKAAITFVANTIYKEHYQTLPMKHKWETTDEQLLVEYQWKLKEEWQKFAIQASNKAVEIEKGSEAEFITEHYWGYSRKDPKTTFEYEVTHPRWQQYQVDSYQIAVDFGKVYGSEFSFINQSKPASVMLAEGSMITVEKRRCI